MMMMRKSSERYKNAALSCKGARPYLEYRNFFFCYGGLCYYALFIFLRRRTSFFSLLREESSVFVSLFSFIREVLHIIISDNKSIIIISSTFIVTLREEEEDDDDHHHLEPFGCCGERERASVFYIGGGVIIIIIIVVRVNPFDSKSGDKR